MADMPIYGSYRNKKAEELMKKLDAAIEGEKKAKKETDKKKKTKTKKKCSIWNKKTPFSKK